MRTTPKHTAVLKRNFQFDREGHTFLYLARAGRFQAYSHRVDPHTGELDKFFQHEDEKDVWLSSQAEGHKLADEFMENDQFS